MLGWCIVTLASGRLKASVWFPPLRGMYQRGGTCKGCDRSAPTPPPWTRTELGPTRGSLLCRRRASPPISALLPVAIPDAASSAAVPVEPGLTVPWTGPEETRMAPCRLTSVSSWASMRVPVEAKALELEQARPRPFRAVNPDPG